MENKKIRLPAEVLDKLPRISREEFMENLYEILDQVMYEQAGFVITDEGHSGLLLCPVEWFGLQWDKDLSISLYVALKQVISQNNGNTDAVFNSICKNIWRIDTGILREMCVMAEAAGTEQARQLHAEILAEIQYRGDDGGCA